MFKYIVGWMTIISIILVIIGCMPITKRYCDAQNLETRVAELERQIVIYQTLKDLSTICAGFTASIGILSNLYLSWRHEFKPKNVQG